MGLRFPTDLGAWHEWQASRNRVRRLKARFTGEQQAPLYLASSSGTPSILVVVDAATPSQIAAYLAPALEVEAAGIAVLSGADVSHLVPSHWSKEIVGASLVPASLSEVRVVFASGHFLPASAAAFEWCEALGATFVVAQHGLITPFQPPLPPNAHLLAFTRPDAEFWVSGRTDVTHDVVGSQILWRAAQTSPGAAMGEDQPPVFLGQLHGAELPRKTSARTAETFCLTNGAQYRPHPAETDKMSRLQHAVWKRRGVKFERSGQRLGDLAAPVVSIFSTGVLEAAASGRRSWVTCVDPPDWIREFWSRYGLSEWGQEPTLALPAPDIEPSRAVANSLKRILEGAA
ncbi:hypothetical protein [Pseudoclavibacter helvolus]|uniref:hypothetical protein n=1 Tax=Pseudoclavibacter helvolus TaxID=255205 RepID=UPI000837FFD7|nr:hypothetical protein [Pseudoclavibacter helvolus]